MKENEILHLDIRDKKCPMTTVYIRASFDSLLSGQILEITLKGHDTYRNISDMLKIIPCKIVKDFQSINDSDVFSGVITKP
ncbi:sulfurtransferase TusA family protein [Neokomagataea anthophila]|uniref:Sulfurtransferase TusA family protein n=1 Tax=Neokomagataea anthophila TaxID=2826925 RepID=A0ABS5E8S7_9PROT|nr:sulfurtransferase TusA family protein [Neokomagataea anthophila]